MNYYKNFDFEKHKITKNTKFSDIPIMFIIEQNDNYFFYRGKKYLFGDALLELSNLNISAIKNKIFNLKNIVNINYELFENLAKQRISSFYFRISRDCIREYLEENKYLDVNQLDDLNIVYNLLMDMFQLLSNMKERCITLFSYLDSSSNNNKNRTFVEKLSILQNETGFFDDVIPTVSKTKITQNGLEFEYSFFNIQDFLKYEFVNFVKTPQKIAQCKNCSKYFRINREGTKFCSKKCKDRFNQEILNKNIFYRKYLNKYKYLNKKYYLNDFCTKATQLRYLYDEYKLLPQTSQNIQKYVIKLKEIK